MKRITEISLCNYRAFLNKPGEEDKYKISLPKGENLFIYGENGSGKSSLFKGLKDFFLSTNDPAIQPVENIFSEVGFPDTEIKVNISDQQGGGSYSLIETLIFNNDGSTTSSNPNLLNSSNAFLTYRDILQTYLIYNNEEKNPNLFDIFIEKLLGRITDEATSNKIYEVILDIECKIRSLPKAVEELKLFPHDDDPEQTKEEAIGTNGIAIELLQKIDIDLAKVNSDINDLLGSLFVEVNKYLSDYFKSNIEVDIANKNSFLTRDGARDGENFDYNLLKSFFLDVKYFEKQIDTQDYPSFLNEARLSSIAICLYLAAVKQDKPAKDNLKFLFLDDIFIGVDMSNRIPLLKILADDFKEFQIFISTYDREWFELARRWMNQTELKFRHIELYEGIDDTVNPPTPFPVLIDPSMNYEEKAIYYYKIKDYPAAANYLRKTCESKLKDILPMNMRYKESDGEIVEIELLGELYTKFKEYCRKNCFNVNALKQFETYTKIIFNSLSHDDLSANHYKLEIEEALKIVREFDKFKIKKILDPKILKTALYNSDDPTGPRHHYEIDLKENLYWIQYDNQPAKFSVAQCQLKGSSFSCCVSLHNALTRILGEHGYDITTSYATLCTSIQATNSKKLNELMTF